MKELKTKESRNNFYFSLVALVLVVVLGVLSGRLLASWRKSTGKETERIAVSAPGEGSKVKKGEIYGRKDGVFKDTATGMLQAGGIDGEGTHHLLREGGESQTVYLFSSSLDLDLFIGRKVQVWGQTFAAQKAGWLMDVGRVKVLE